MTVFQSIISWIHGSSFEGNRSIGGVSILTTCKYQLEGFRIGMCLEYYVARHSSILDDFVCGRVSHQVPENWLLYNYILAQGSLCLRATKPRVMIRGN